MSQWVRLWEDMPTDPKWRVIARRSGRPLPEVISVFTFMLINAGAASERGTLESWNDEDVGAALDIDGEHVAAIREAMQGKTLEGDHLSGWERRQPKREDGSAERAKAHRERNRTQSNATEHLPKSENAPERPEEKREDKIDPSSLRSDDADSASSLDEDPKSVLFGEGLVWLAKAAGKTEAQVRPLVGKMLRDMGGDVHAAALLGIFRDTRRERKADPLGWILSMVSNRPRAGPPPRPERRNPHIEALEMNTLRPENECHRQSESTASDLTLAALAAVEHRSG
jgi:hypothetical protein